MNSKDMKAKPEYDEILPAKKKFKFYKGLTVELVGVRFKITKVLSGGRVHMKEVGR